MSSTLSHAVEMVPAKNGSLVPKVDGIFLESRYDPEREAEKRAAAVELEGRRAVLLLGDGGYYLSRYLAAHFSGTIIVAEACPELPEMVFSPEETALPSNVSIIATQSVTSIAAFSALLPESATDLAVVEHPVCRRIFSEEYQRFSGLMMEFLRRGVADLATTGYFGRRWLFNILDNAAEGSPGLEELRAAGDWVIAVPGPTLDATLERIRRHRDSLHLCAVLPAVRQLEAAGIAPDVVCTMDGGLGNALHAAGLGCTAPLLAALYTHPGVASCWRGPVHFVSLGLAVEERLFSQIPAMRERPTVAGFALDAAVALGAERVFLAGQDFAALHGRDHCRDYRFVQDARNALTRIDSLHKFREYPQKLEGGWHSSEKFLLYASGFMEQVRQSGSAVASLVGSPALSDVAVCDAACEFGTADAARKAGRKTRLNRVWIAELDAALDAALAALASQQNTGEFAKKLLDNTVLMPILELLRQVEIFALQSSGTEQAAENLVKNLAEDLQCVKKKLEKALNT